MPRKTASKQTSKKRANDYSQNWVKWVVIYLLIGGLIYLAVYALFFQKGYSDSYGSGNSTQQTSSYP